MDDNWTRGLHAYDLVGIGIDRCARLLDPIYLGAILTNLSYYGWDVGWITDPIDGGMANFAIGAADFRLPFPFGLDVEAP